MAKGILITLLIIILIGSGFFYWKYYFTYSDGNRTGLLQKFSRKGNLFKTYEGELVLNSLTTSGNNAIGAEKFYFSVDENKVAAKMMTLEGQRVVLHYQEKNGNLWWRGDTNYIVDSIRILTAN